MELTKKTTILFPPDLHEQLVNLAKARGCSLGELVRTAVRLQYGVASRRERLEAATTIANMSAPVAPVEQLIAESTPPHNLPE